MRMRLSLITLALLCLTTLPAVAQQWGRPHPPRMGACFYREAGFVGDYFCMKVGERWPTMPPGFNDRISSIRVFNGAVVRLFEDSNFAGDRVRIQNDVDNLKNVRLRRDPSRNWNDRVSALAVVRDHDDWDRGHGDDDRDRDRRN